jgi:glycosyltransferase involved in cell wall biosynthesis
MAGWLARASVYCLPARYEPFGLSALEAAMSGCALVLGDTPSLREIWGRNAIFVPPDDHETLVLVLNALATDSTLREKMAARAARRGGLFDAYTMAQSYQQLYRHMLGQSRHLPDTQIQTRAWATAKGRIGSSGGDTA